VSLWGWRSTGTGCPERLSILLLWRYSRPAWTRSCAACSRWPCFGRGCWTRWPTDVPSNPDHSVILWCENRLAAWTVSATANCHSLHYFLHQTGKTSTSGQQERDRHGFSSRRPECSSRSIFLCPL